MLLERKNNRLTFLETNLCCALIGALALAPSAVPGEKLPTRQRKTPDGNKGDR